MTGCHVSGLSRNLETLGTAVGKIASGHYSPVRFVRGCGGWYAVVWYTDRLVQLGGTVLRIR
jgi:hypothetical protein